jgi:hypothetical protein
MKANQTSYRDLRGREYRLTDLSLDEQAFVRRLIAEAERLDDWNAFDNYWMTELAAFYETRGLTRRQMQETAAYRIAQDLSGRIAVRHGLAEPPDYRDELEDLIHREFATRHAFCEATGLSDDMVSHVLARRKQLAIDTLETALSKIGYGLRIIRLSEQDADQPVKSHSA